MALNTDYREIKYYKRKLYTKLQKGENGYKPNEVTFKIKPRMETIILGTMITGVPNITEKTWEKFYNRIHLLETVNGSFFMKKYRGKIISAPITKDEVKSLIGLKSNATKLTLKQFLKRFDQEKL